MSITAVLLSVLFLLVPMSSTAWGQQLTFTDLGWGMAAYGINDAGQIVGTELGEVSCDGPSDCRASARYHGFRTNPGIEINYPRANFYFTPGVHTAYTKAYGISSTGEIVGWARNDTGLHAFLRDTTGRFTATLLYPYGINATGQIVAAGGVLSGGTFTPIHVPGALSSVPAGI